MKKFFVKFGLFISVFFLLNLSIVALPENSNDFIHAILDKHKLLQSTKGEKRLIIAGGSNVAFGVDSKEIEEELGIKTINVSVHAGMGLKYVLDDLDRYVKKGDIVLLIPEYQMFYDDKFYGGTETIEALRINPENLGSVNPMQINQMLKGYPLYVRSKIGYTALNLLGVKKFGDIYFRDSFNEYGDLVAHIGQENVQFSTACPLNKLNTEVFSYIDKVNKKFNDRGATLLVSFPSLDKTAYDTVVPQVEEIDKTLKEDTEIGLISKSKDYIFGHELFYNSIYHLNGEGRNLRTAKLIYDLKGSGCF
jgi:hypothetical protein